MSKHKPAKKPIIEEGEYKVRVIFTTTVTFSPIERDTELTIFDAVANARGQMPEVWFKEAEAEGWTLSYESERLS